MIPPRVFFAYALMQTLNRFQQPAHAHNMFGTPMEPPEPRDLSKKEQALYDSSVSVMQQYVLGEIEDREDQPQPPPCNCPECVRQRGGHGGHGPGYGYGAVVGPWGGGQ